MQRVQDSAGKNSKASWTHPLIYGAFRGFVATTSAIGIEHSIELMRTLGSAYTALPANRKRLERVKTNIRWCFPEWDEDRVHACGIEAYRHLFTLAPEIALSSELITPDSYAKYVRIGKVRDGLRELLSDRPCLLVTGHNGNWELLGATLATLGIPMHALYRPMDVKPLDDWLKTTRGAQGLELIDKFGAVKRLPELLDAGESVAFIADQNAGERGLFVPFFNRLSSAYKTIGVLAMQYRTPIICGGATRLSGGIDADDSSGRARFRYRLDIEDIIRPEDWDQQPDPLFYITARYRHAIERMVRQAPEQYLWLHRYWKTRPRHERQGQPLPDRLCEKIRSLPWMTEEDLERIEQRSLMDTKELQTGTRGTK